MRSEWQAGPADRPVERRDGAVDDAGGRRRLLAGLGALLGGAAMLQAGRGDAAPLRNLRFIGGGVAGGGVAKLADGEAHFALFATRLQPEGGPLSFLGRILWVDRAPSGRTISLESAEIEEYAPIPGVPTGRFARGTMRVNGAGSYPFRLEVVDVGPPGSGQDTVSLAVGSDVSDFGYTAIGTVATGDIELLTFDFTVPT